MVRIPEIPDGIDVDEHIVATYYLENPLGEGVSIANAFALEQSTGTWTEVPVQESEEVKRRTAKVVGVHKIPAPMEGTTPMIIQLAFPIENIPPEFSTLLASVAGNIMMFTREGWSIKLLDLEFPEPWLSEFDGPQFGMNGIRDLLDVHDRPILNNMIKPCTGHTVETHAELFREAAYGGMDIIKDDELLTNPRYNSFFERLEKCMEIVEEREEETGERTIYTINVTCAIADLLERAEKAVEEGANGLLLDSSVGLSGLRMLAEDPNVDVPILYHPDFIGNICGSERSGIDWTLYNKLIRMAGADIIFTGDYRGKFPGGTKDLSFKNISTVTSEFKHISPAAPFVTGGGVHPGVVPGLVEDYGNDIIIGVGGGLHGHPSGPRAGGRALRQAVDAAIEKVPLSEAADEHEELKAALDKWGIVESSKEAEELYETR